ncbi:Amino cyclopropane -1- carboxylate deaminase [Glutamicibacter phage Montesquieu]|nr:Amino cyclopropane -1- carboxylate deaminase [Glutamicibacter phage Montesquieu]
MKTTLPLNAVTPLQLRDGIYFKRDDLQKFENGVSGKVRTSIWLSETAKELGADTLVYGGSVLAPALGRVASAAAYSGLKSQILIGSDPEKAIERHPTVRVAAEAGAELIRTPVAYNPYLQKKAREIAELSQGSVFQVPYGVSTDPVWPTKWLQDFLDCDVEQAADVIQTGVTDLVVPFGSANAASGVFWSLDALGYGKLKTIHLMGIGPDKTEWFWARLAEAGLKREEVERHVEINLIPLHPFFAEYADRMPETYKGIDFHPIYEGKMIRYLNMVKPEFWTRQDGTTCFWIVGCDLNVQG